VNEFPRMLFKANGKEPIHGGLFQTFIVDNAELMDNAIADGWCMTTTEAVEAAAKPVEVPADDAPPTRDELKRKATELGIDYPANIPTDKLAGLVAEAV
jgi:hypothetical protein